MDESRPGGFDYARFVEVITQIAKRLETKEYKGLKKLAKIMYYIDFRAFGRLGHSITGANYVKLDYGPFPSGIGRVIEESAHLSLVSEPIGAVKQDVVVSDRDPDISVFDEGEVRLMEACISEFADATGADLERQSHQEMSWHLTPDKEIISYRRAYLGERGKAPQNLIAAALEAAREQ